MIAFPVFDERAEDVYHRPQRTIKRMVSPDGKAGADADIDVEEVREGRREERSAWREGNRRRTDFLRCDKRCRAHDECF